MVGWLEGFACCMAGKVRPVDVGLSVWVYRVGFSVGGPHSPSRMEIRWMPQSLVDALWIINHPLPQRVAPTCLVEFMFLEDSSTVLPVGIIKIKKKIKKKWAGGSNFKAWGESLGASGLTRLQGDVEKHCLMIREAKSIRFTPTIQTHVPHNAMGGNKESRCKTLYNANKREGVKKTMWDVHPTPTRHQLPKVKTTTKQRSISVLLTKWHNMKSNSLSFESWKRKTADEMSQILNNLNELCMFFKIIFCTSDSALQVEGKIKRNAAY